MKTMAWGLALLLASTGFAKDGINESEVLEADKRTKKHYFVKKVVDDVKISGNNKSLAGRKQFIAPSFRVNYLIDGKYRNDVGGITSSKRTVHSTLSGVENDQFQAITEAMYDEFVARLKEAGFDVGDHTTNSGFSNFKMKKSYPHEKSGKVVTLPDGLIAQQGFSHPAMKLIMADREAAVLVVDLTVDFVIHNRNKKKFTFGNKAAVETSQGISVTGQMSINDSKSGVTVALGQPVTSPNAFGKVADATKGTDKASDVIYGVGQWIGGGGLGNRKKTTRASVVADPDLYAEAAKDALGSVSATFVDALNKVTASE